MKFTAKSQKSSLPGARHAALHSRQRQRAGARGLPARPERVQRHTVEHMADSEPVLPMLVCSCAAGGGTADPRHEGALRRAGPRPIRTGSRRTPCFARRSRWRCCRTCQCPGSTSARAGYLFWTTLAVSCSGSRGRGGFTWWLAGAGHHQGTPQRGSPPAQSGM